MRQMPPSTLPEAPSLSGRLDDWGLVFAGSGDSDDWGVGPGGEGGEFEGVVWWEGYLLRPRSLPTDVQWIICQNKGVYIYI